MTAAPPALASDTAAALELDPAERDLLQLEIAALAAAVSEGSARGRYAELAAAVGEGRVSGEPLAALEGVLELTLGTGRARRLHGPEGERQLLRLYQQTPRGAAIAERTGAANRALGALAGQTLHGISFTALGPGVYRLEIATDRCQLTLETGRLGVTVDSVGVDL